MKRQVTEQQLEEILQKALAESRAIEVFLDGLLSSSSKPPTNFDIMVDAMNALEENHESP